MVEDKTQPKHGTRKVVAKCPECGSPVDATYLAFDYLDRLGVWDGIED